jgi:hypothetical protein
MSEELTTEKRRLAWHRNLGEVWITEACDYLQNSNPDPSSCFVEHDGDVKEVTRNLVKEGEPWFERASGDVLCETCGKKYYDHPMYRKALDWNGNAVLNELCDGRLVKL